MTTSHTPGRLYIRTNRHPNIDGTPWGWVDLYEPGSMRQSSPAGIQVTWSRGQKSEANARRLVACWNACEDITTDELKEIAATGGMLGPREDVARIAKQRDELLAAAQTTLAKNLHLADGDNCTLIDLKRAVERITGVEV